MAPRVVVVGLASDFGCQVQMTNIEDDLLAVLGLIDLSYWQLASSGHMPEEYDVALIEGAVTTAEHVDLLREVRKKASVVIALGSCAVTGGIPGIAASGDVDAHCDAVYGAGSDVARGRVAPRAVPTVVPVDYVVPGCPIDTAEYLQVLSRALNGLSDKTPQMPLCGACKTRENECFIHDGTMCLGLVTRAGCSAACTTLGRPCTGCRGIAPDANLSSAREIFAAHGWDLDGPASALSLYNNDREVSR